MDNAEIYHMTYIGNLYNILSKGVILSKNMMRNRSVRYQSIAHEDIQDKRDQVAVPLPPEGNLHDYVPFYFTPRTPMMYALHRRNVPSYEGTDEDIVYLKTSVQHVILLGEQYVFTDGHAIMDYVRFFNSPADLNELYWNIINAKYWNDFTDGRCRRQAEFLVFQSLSLCAIEEIGVKTERMKIKVALH
ncbi:MAG: DUF4433 domain-containing protein [Selenomonas sp.]|nr:DUF4433 domain-containing protein [Selenomonas sp.]